MGAAAALPRWVGEVDCRAEVSLDELAPTAEGVVKVLLGPAARRGCGLGWIEEEEGEREG